MKTLISQDGTIGNTGDIQPDGLGFTNFSALDPGIVPEPVRNEFHTIASPPVAVNPSGLVIDVSFDDSITNVSTGLATISPAIYQGYTNAIQAAVQFWETEITNPVTVDITFGWNEADSQTVPIAAAGFNVHSLVPVTYDTLFSAVQSLSGLSAVQQTAYALLPASDPTGGGVFVLGVAEARALGILSPAIPATDGWIGLNNALTYSFDQSSIADGTFDATGAIEHEISEVLGRFDEVGSPTSGPGSFFPSGSFDSGTPRYTLLDFYHYTAAGEAQYDGVINALPTKAPGSPAGVLSEPFVGGYNPLSFTYFSFDGTHVTLPYDTPPNIQDGADPGDWAPTVIDSFGYTTAGLAGPVSTADLQQMNLLGFSVTCFREGTRILTTAGEKPVETLSIGDTVPTVLGTTGRVVWLGRRVLDLSKHPMPRRAWPVMIRAGAFAPGSPARDLYLSPEHSVYINEVLIPVKLLINDSTIRQVKVDRVVYHHVELDQHDVIQAEGLPCESYLDTGDRDTFSGGTVTALYPEFSARRWEMSGCAPLVLSGAALTAARSRLAERAVPRGQRDAGPTAVGR
jgi:hypothetical protein